MLKNTIVYTSLEDCKKDNPEHIGTPNKNWINRTGLKFNSLTIIYYCQDLKYVIAKCDCGNYKKINIHNIVNNRSKTCGCCSKFEDLTGQRFGKLVVINRSNINVGTTKKWFCQCDCGQTCYVEPRNLKSGYTQSCGCLAKEKASERFQKNNPSRLQDFLENPQKSTKICNLTGQKFGLLTAVYPTEKRKDTHIIWACLCDCGNVHFASSTNLKKGNVTSCGCRNSKNEGIIQNYLQKLQKNFESRYYIYNKNTNTKMYFDFFVNNYYMIEYDGKQHFTGYSDKQSYELIHKRDLIKNKYCFDNNIPLIRIPYNVEYTIDDLKLETTRFLLTPENEKEYYDDRIGT